MATYPVSRGPHKQFFFLIVPVLVIGVLADQASKSWACFQAVEPRFLVPGYVIAYVVPNAGAFLGLCDDRAWANMAFVLLGIGCAGLLSRLSCTDRVPWQRADCLAGAILLAGIFGNDIDRVALGYVRDFLVTWAIPSLAFNVADLLVVVGAAFLFMARYRGGRRSRPDLGHLALALA